MDTYEDLGKLVNFEDVGIPLSLSTFCELVENKLPLTSRLVLVEAVRNYLIQSPKGIASSELELIDQLAARVANRLYPDCTPEQKATRFRIFSERLKAYLLPESPQGSPIYAYGALNQTQWTHQSSNRW